MFTINPDAIPHIWLTMDDFKAQFVYIKAVYHKSMDKPEQRCESSKSYSFTTCIKNSISRMVGCRLKRDGWSSRTIPVCKGIQQLLQFEQKYEEIDTLMQDSIVELTCVPPCSFTEYKLATEPNKFKEAHELY